MTTSAIKDILEKAYLRYNRIDFIKDDPISIPHAFSKKQDIEIIGFWVAILSWGKREIIIRKGHQLLELMDHSPHKFICQHQASDLKAFSAFKHRTFQEIDTLYFLRFLKHHFQQHESLEEAFLMRPDTDMKNILTNFEAYFFSLTDAPHRTRKHISSPARNSSCKRLNMFLRWMVRKDNNGVDFGIWNKIDPKNLLCPLDVHVHHTATHLGLLKRKQVDWKATQELTEQLRKIDPKDPVKYDFSLFGLGIEGIGKI